MRASPGAVQVMTMHGAKGLEFDCVYVLGVQQSRMPGQRRGPRDPVPEALLKEDLPEDSARRTRTRCGASCTWR